MLQDKPLKIFFPLLLLKAALLWALMAWLGIGLAPDEAQYWVWGQNLDWGYYSKPPLIAWQIFATTSLLGDSEWGVRLGAQLIGILIPFMVYYLGRCLSLSEKHSILAALLLALSPLGFYFSMAATTDGGATLGFLLALIALVSKREIGVGFGILFGALYKWVVFLFWPFLFVLLPFFPALNRRKLAWAFLLSLAALLPTLYWNMSHDFATFRHTMATVKREGGGGNPLDFFLGQIALFSPFVLWAIVIAWKKRPKSALFLFPLFALGYLALSFFKKMQPNWALFLYPPLFLLAPLVIKRKALLLTATLFSALLPFVIAPYSYLANPFRQCLGWHQLSTLLQEQPGDFLFSDRYQTTSLLHFYQERKAYFFNLSSMRQNQFSYLPSMSQEKGKNGLFILVENTASPLDHKEEAELKLAPYFEKIAFLGAYPLVEVGGQGRKYALLFQCSSYLGEMPKNSYKY